jgi:hypothetical protein
MAGIIVVILTHSLPFAPIYKDNYKIYTSMPWNIADKLAKGHKYNPSLYNTFKEIWNFGRTTQGIIMEIDIEA